MEAKNLRADIAIQMALREGIDLLHRLNADGRYYDADYLGTRVLTPLGQVECGIGAEDDPADFCDDCWMRNEFCICDAFCHPTPEDDCLFPWDCEKDHTHTNDQGQRLWRVLR